MGNRVLFFEVVRAASFCSVMLSACAATAGTVSAVAVSDCFFISGFSLFTAFAFSVLPVLNLITSLF